MELERAELGIDGNCGFALLGENIQEGEAEFVEIGPANDLYARLLAPKQALKKLKLRLNKPELSYFFGTSHPYGT